MKDPKTDLESSTEIYEDNVAILKFNSSNFKDLRIFLNTKFPECRLFCEKVKNDLQATGKEVKIQNKEESK